MADHLTEEEQVEAFKRWWKDNGTSLLVGVIVAVLGYFAWQNWQTSQTAAREQSSLIYDELLQIVNSDPSKPIAEGDVARVESIVGELKTDYSGSTYAQHAALHLAKVAVEQNDLTKAETELRWIIEQDPEPALAELANLRLAQVLYAQNNNADALALASVSNDSQYAIAFAELRGDILTEQQQWSEAVAAYEYALENLTPAQAAKREIIQMKLDDLPRTEVSASESDG